MSPPYNVKVLYVSVIIILAGILKENKRTAELDALKKIKENGDISKHELMSWTTLPTESTTRICGTLKELLLEIKKDPILAMLNINEEELNSGFSAIESQSDETPDSEVRVYTCTLKVQILIGNIIV